MKKNRKSARTVPRPRPENKAEKLPRPALFGFHAVREAWLNPARSVRALYLTEAATKGFEASLLEARQAGLQRPVPLAIDKHRLEKMLPPGAVHQGIALEADDLAELDARDLIIRAEGRERSVLLMLDQVTDPHNVGAIIRSACAFGCAGIVMQRRHAPALTGVLAKTACGGLEHVPVAFETNLSRACETLQDGGFFVYGLDERGEEEIGAVKKSGGPDRIVLVLGAEGSGLRPLVRAHCDRLVRLPTKGAIASLNVSNAASVALYAVV